jgi:predicted DsbA family dithiol-disulfide isomerase
LGRDGPQSGRGSSGARQRRLRRAVADDLREARSLGITGVPFFVIDGRYGISGAQQAEVFSQALARTSGKNATSLTRAAGFSQPSTSA